MSEPSVVVIGGGLAGMGAAFALGNAGLRDVTIVERGSELGGLAGTFERDGHFYPLAYHHILHRDRTLLWFLERIGELSHVQWRRIRMLFHVGGELHQLSSLGGFLRYPLGVADKLRFIRLMMRTFRKSSWDDWHDRSAAELVDRWGGPGVRRALFEPLTRIKFDLPCDQVSGAWLGARLHHREGSAPLGYIAGANWTQRLTNGLERLLCELGVTIRLRTGAVGLAGGGGRIRDVHLADGSALHPDLVVSTLPPPIYCAMTPDDATPELRSIRYTAVLSAICVVPRLAVADFYWLNLTGSETAASGIFQLNSLNPTIGGPGEACLNFMNHVPSRDHPSFARSDDEIWSGYFADWQRLFGTTPQPTWRHLIRIPTYSPIFTCRYRNPPIRSATWQNVWFAGNFRTYPSVASTGTALHSGLEAATALLRELGRKSDLLSAVAGFRAH